VLDEDNNTLIGPTTRGGNGNTGGFGGGTLYELKLHDWDH
jgi:hypothetical protein